MSTTGVDESEGQWPSINYLYPKHLFYSTLLATQAINSYLTNYGQKKSINNIQDLGLSTDSR
jgi:hypothetical protein